MCLNPSLNDKPIFLVPVIHSLRCLKCNSESSAKIFVFLRLLFLVKKLSTMSLVVYTFFFSLLPSYNKHENCPMSADFYYVHT